MKIVVLDGYAENPGDLSWEGFSALGDLTVYDRTPDHEAQIISRIADAEVILTNKTPLSRRVFDACPSIRYVGVLATGYNVVDTAAAKARGIPVCNVPAYGTQAVAQFTIALLLELCHRAALHSDAVHAGEWEASPDFCFWKTPQVELAGKTMGIIGFGRIGQAVGRIANAFGMNVLATGSRETDAGRQIARYTDLDTLLKASDVVSLHCPLTAQNEKLICREALAKMKRTAFLLNTARGQLVDERALAEALLAGEIAGAAVDVVSREPISPENPLLTAKNCIITPHIAWAPKESRQRIMDTSIENLRAFLAGSPKNVVNE